MILGSAANSQEDQRSGRSSRGVSREGSVSLGSARSVDTNPEKQEDMKVEEKKEEKMESIIEGRSEYKSIEQFEDRREKPRRLEESVNYQERPHYQDNRTYRREEDRYNDKSKDKYRHSYHGREGAYRDNRKYYDKRDLDYSRRDDR